MQEDFLVDEQFAKNLIDFYGNLWIEENRVSYLYHLKQASEQIKAFITYSLRDGFSCEWSMGGTSNNCFAVVLHHKAEEEPELETLDKFLGEFYPKISYLQYKSVHKHAETQFTNDRDYYGGSIKRAKKSIGHADIYAALLENGLAEEENLVHISSLNDYIEDNYSVLRISEKF